MDKVLNLTNMELDALSEMGNIGTGNAATALSKMIQKNVEMNIPQTRFISIKEFAKDVGGPENIVSGIYLRIDGDFKGQVVFLFPKEGSIDDTKYIRKVSSKGSMIDGIRNVRGKKIKYTFVTYFQGRLRLGNTAVKLGIIGANSNQS